VRLGDGADPPRVGVAADAKPASVGPLHHERRRGVLAAGDEALEGTEVGGAASGRGPRQQGVAASTPARGLHLDPHPTVGNPDDEVEAATGDGHLEGDVERRPGGERMAGAEMLGEESGREGGLETDPAAIPDADDGEVRSPVRPVVVAQDEPPSRAEQLVEPAGVR